MAFTQENRFMVVSTALGDDELLITGLKGTEGISQLFQFELELISNNNAINFKDIIGTNATVSIALPTGDERYFNGIISSFSQGGAPGEVEATDPQFSHYSATMVPWTWLLTRTADLRIFQEKSVPDIIEQIFSEKGLSDYQNRLSGSYEPREYCVQYRETDFDFISRLMEEEGIFYFFEHENGKHTMVLADSAQEHKPCPYHEVAKYKPMEGHLEENVISSLSVSQAIQPGKYAHTDYNFEIPNFNMLAEATGADNKNLGPGEKEVYDYPGKYEKIAAGQNYAEIRMEELEAGVMNVSGAGNISAFISGYSFKLEEYFRDDMNKDYVLRSVSHEISQTGYEMEGSSQGENFSYKNDFTCFLKEVPFRPPRVTPRPIVEGAHTAIVVGESGEEIYTDKYGRVKVQFHWDREGKADENSSCWIRVSQGWAGANWGAMFIPRVGHEVIVDFLEGDPDRPIITGRVYHGINMPPYELPAEKTKSTVKSYSSKGGGGFNELRFEDKKGEEQIFIHGEKNFDLRIKNDRFETVDNDRHLHVGKDKKENIENNRHEKVGADHYEEIGKDRHLLVKGKEAKEVDGSHSFTVKGDVIEVFKANHSEQTTSDYYLKADNIVIEGMTNVTVKVGQSFIAIEASGIKIGTTGQIVLDAKNTVDIKGTAGITVESPAQATLKSANTTVKGDAMVTIQGGIVKIN